MQKLIVDNFADDTIFCEANCIQLRYLQCLFLCFEVVTRLKINLANSKLVPIGDVVFFFLLKFLKRRNDLH
jgi:hypothetical protein